MIVPTLSDPTAIANCNLQAPNSDVSLIQIEHRLKLLTTWGIKEGDTVYEIGCGQGDATSVLATAVGSTGKVTGVDPAPLSYGAPFTLQQAQDFMSKSPIGPRIEWVQADPIAHLEANPSLHFDVAIFCHSVFYFASPELLSKTLSILSKHATKIIISEWSLRATAPLAHSHVLAVLTECFLETHKSSTTSNIRTVVSPGHLKEVATTSGGLKLLEESYLVPQEELHDGGWEAGNVYSKSFLKEIEDNVKEERELAVVLAARDACVAAIELGGGVKKVRSMDVWTGIFSSA